MLHANLFKKNLALSQKSTFLPVLRRFCMRALRRRFEWKMPIFCPRPPFLAGSSIATAIFPRSASKGLTTYYALFGQLASRRVRQI